jgi:hypothetical protein
VSQQSVAADHCPIAFSYAAGPGVLARHLQLLAYPGVSMNAPGLDVLVGQPLTPSPIMSRLLFYVDANGEVKRSLFVTPSGDRQRLDVVSCTPRVKPKPSLFAFSPPPFVVLVPPPGASLLTAPLP